jgi:Protein of unknown function (DUF2934)
LKCLKKDKPTNQEISRIMYGPDTSGCPIKGLPDLIRKRAYQLFGQRGRQPGHEMDDWLQAERETNQYLGA